MEFIGRIGVFDHKSLVGLHRVHQRRLGHVIGPDMEVLERVEEGPPASDASGLPYARVPHQHRVKVGVEPIRRSNPHLLLKRSGDRSDGGPLAKENRRL